MTTNEFHDPQPTGTQTAPPPVPPPSIPGPIPIRRSHNRVLGGVVAGLAERANVDVTMARLLAVVAFIFSAGTVSVAYVAGWLLMPGPDSDHAPIARWTANSPTGQPS